MVEKIKNFAVKRKQVLIIALTIAVFFAPFFFSPQILSGKDNDLGRTYIPVISFYKTSLFKFKQLPLWRSDQMMGEPTVSNPLYQFLYPLDIIFLLPQSYAAFVFFFVHFLLAAIATYSFSRYLGFSKQSSMAGALIYALSLKMLMHTTAGHLTMVPAFSYFPLVVLSASHLSSKFSFKWVTIGALALWAMYINYPTVFYYAFLFLVLYVFYNLIKRSTDLKKHAPKLLLNFAILFFVWLGLSAIALIPHTEFAPLSTRSDLKIEDIAIPLWNKTKLVLSLLFPYPILSSLDHESLLYLGLTPLALSTFAFFKLKKLQKTFLLVGFLLAIVLVLNLSTPLFPTLYENFPLLKYSRVTTRLWFIIAFLAAILSAFALSSINRSKVTIFTLTIFALESVFIFYTTLFRIPNLNFTDKDIYQYLEKDKEPYRIFCATYCFNPQLLSASNLQLLNGETPIQQKSFVNYLASAGGYRHDQFAVIFPPYQTWQEEVKPKPNAILLGDANTKYIATTYEISNPLLNFVGKFDNLLLYQNNLFLKRAYFSNSQQQIEITKYSPNNVELKFPMANFEREIIFSENYYPGWYVLNNNTKRPVSQFNQVFRSFKVAANTTEASLKFEPRSFALGRTITFATICVLILIYPKLKGKKK